MRVTKENWDEYLATENCRFRQTYYTLNYDNFTECLDVICMRGVDPKDLKTYRSSPDCVGCVGKGCEYMEERKPESGPTWKVEGTAIIIEDTKG